MSMKLKPFYFLKRFLKPNLLPPFFKFMTEDDPRDVFSGLFFMMTLSRKLRSLYQWVANITELEFYQWWRVHTSSLFFKTNIF